jgi:hypothetical protein
MALLPPSGSSLDRAANLVIDARCALPFDRQLCSWPPTAVWSLLSLDGEVKPMASSPGLLALDHPHVDQFLQLLLHLAHGLARQFGQVGLFILIFVLEGDRAPVTPARRHGKHVWCHDGEAPHDRGMVADLIVSESSQTRPARPAWRRGSRAEAEQSYGVVAATSIIFGSGPSRSLRPPVLQN